MNTLQEIAGFFVLGLKHNSPVDVFFRKCELIGHLVALGSTHQNLHGENIVALERRSVVMEVLNSIEGLTRVLNALLVVHLL